MNLSKPSIRRWWKPPRKVEQLAKSREISWLELFYDLVYVVLIARVAAGLADSMNPRGFAGFAFMFAIVWLAWFNGALYHDLHGNRDLRTRVFTFLQMFTVAGMAVFATNALTESATGFAVFYAAFLLILAYLWWRSGIYEPALRHLTRPNALAIGLTALLYLFSLFLPSEWRLPLWASGLAIILLIPLAKLVISGDDPLVAGPKRLIVGVSSSLVERFALLTLIVLGEFVSDIVHGVADHHSQSWLVGVTAVLAMVIAIAFWWLYFDVIAMRLPRPWLGTQVGWMYLHLPMTLGLVAAAAAVLDVIEYAGEPTGDELRRVLMWGFALAMLAVSALMSCIRVEPRFYHSYRSGGLSTAVCAILMFLLGFSNLRGGALMLAILLLMLVPVFLGVRVWLDRIRREEEMTLQE